MLLLVWLLEAWGRIWLLWMLLLVVGVHIGAVWLWRITMLAGHSRWIGGFGGLLLGRRAVCMLRHGRCRR